MLGAQDNPGDPTDFVVPIFSTGTESVPSNYSQGSLADYFGIPTGVTVPNVDKPISLPFRAYNKIFNDWYRDQNLQDSAYLDTGNTNDIELNFPLRRRNKKHDYFTSCLPFAQKGEAVNLPLAGTAAIENIEYEDAELTGDGSDHLHVNSHSGVPDPASVPVGDPTSDLRAWQPLYEKVVGAEVNLSEIDAATVNQLRTVIALQHILERNARSGTRDVEILQGKYGVAPSDERLQRAELVGYSRGRLNVNTVVQTSSSTETSPLGELSAVGTIKSGLRFSYSAVENGYLLIIASARAEITYQQGLRKMWSKRSALDFLDPMMSNIGEQPVLRKELCLVDNTTYNNEVFGYQPNYEDLRFGSNIITGNFRSNAIDSLDIWHFSEEFDVNSPPVLNSDFIQQHSPVSRALAVQNFPHFFGDFFMKCRHTRVLPIHSVPGLRRL